MRFTYGDSTGFHGKERDRTKDHALQEEREKASRFRTAELRQEWTVARGALRCILRACTRINPRTLVLGAGPHGKPELVGPGEDIPFNLSHTPSLALLAVAGTGRVGINAETVHPGIEVEDMSRRFFAPAEADQDGVGPRGATCGLLCLLDS